MGKPLGGDFLCLDCGKDTNESDEYYMLEWDVWAIINPRSRGMLCLECAEKRLGRRLVRKDFLLSAPINEMNAEVCDGLRERLYSTQVT